MSFVAAMFVGIMCLVQLYRGYLATGLQLANPSRLLASVQALFACVFQGVAVFPPVFAWLFCGLAWCIWVSVCVPVHG